MYDRYDSSKGRYVTYDYQPKGDRFSRGLATLPRVWTTVSRYETGRSFIRHTRTNEAQSLTVSQIKELFPPDVAARLEQLTLYFLDTPERLSISEKPISKGFSVRFEVTEQAKGKRHWFKCVGCSRRVGKLYTVKTKHGPFWGCQKCLGLSYPSQAYHKSQGRDMAIVEGKIKVSFDEWVRAHERYEKRMRKLIATFDRLANRMR
jgi:hypothetical protein